MKAGDKVGFLSPTGECPTCGAARELRGTVIRAVGKHLIVEVGAGAWWTVDTDDVWTE